MRFPSDRPTGVRWTIAALLAACAMIAYLDRVVISNVVKEIQEELTLSREEAGWILAAFVIGYGIMQVPMGRLSDRLGSRFALPAIVVLWSLMTGLTAVANTFALLFVVRLGFGMAQAGVFPLTIPALSRWFPLENRGTAQATIVSATRVGAIGAGLAAPLIQTIGWEEAFIACGGVGLVWAIIFIWWFRDRPKEHSAVNEAEVERIGAPATEHEDSRKLPMSTLLTNPNMLGMGLAQFFSAMGFYLYITWFPTYLREVYGFNLGEAGVLTVVPHVGGWIGASLGGPLLDRLLIATGNLRWSRRGIWMAGKGGCGMLFLIAGTMDNSYAAVAVIGCAAFMSDLANPAAWAMVTDVGGRHSGVVFATQNTAGCVGAGLCPLIVPLVASYWGWEKVLPVFGGVFAAAAASWLWVDASRPIPEPTADAG